MEIIRERKGFRFLHSNHIECEENALCFAWTNFCLKRFETLEILLAENRYFTFTQAESKSHKERIELIRNQNGQPYSCV